MKLKRHNSRLIYKDVKNKQNFLIFQHFLSFSLDNFIFYVIIKMLILGFFRI